MAENDNGECGITRGVSEKGVVKHKNMIATERAVKYLRNNAQIKYSGVNRKYFLSEIGITDAEFELLLSGDMLLDEKRFYKLLEVCREYDYSGTKSKYPDWYKETPDWELVGYVERTLTLEKQSGEIITGIQGIVKTPTVIIDMPELYIEEGDKLKRKYNETIEESLMVEQVISNRYQENKPAYVLSVRRSSAVASGETKHNSVNIRGNNNTVVQGESSSVTKTDLEGLIDSILSYVSKPVKAFFSWIKSLIV